MMVLNGKRPLTGKIQSLIVVKTTSGMSSIKRLKILLKKMYIFMVTFS